MTVDYPESKPYHGYFTTNFIEILRTCIEKHTWWTVSEYKNHQSFGLGKNYFGPQCWHFLFFDQISWALAHYKMWIVPVPLFH